MSWRKWQLCEASGMGYRFEVCDICKGAKIVSVAIGYPRCREMQKIKTPLLKVNIPNMGETFDPCDVLDEFKEAINKIVDRLNEL